MQGLSVMSILSGVTAMHRPSSTARSVASDAFTAPRGRYYCAENGLGVCNGNRIDDESRCGNGHCQLFRRCDRVALHEREKVVVNQ